MYDRDRQIVCERALARFHQPRFRDQTEVED